MKYYLTTTFCLSIFTLLFGSNIVFSQDRAVQVSCGTVLEAELTEVYNIVGNEPHQYKVTLAPGDTITITLDPIGNSMTMWIRMFDPTGQQLADSSGYAVREQIKGYTVSARGQYVLGVSSTAIGAYTLSIGCVLRDGTVIEPGTTPTPVVSTQAAPSPILSAPTFGFPGLAPVDFSGAILLPFPLGQFINGQMPATGNPSPVIGFTFNANAGQKFDLQYLRQSGNLNLGIAVMSPTNKVVFQSVLISSDLLVTGFKLDETGQYTIGVFRVDLNPPLTPEATNFQIQGTLS